MSRRVRHGGDDADVNITPLLDIVFIMLIFFIVTATFVYEDGINQICLRIMMKTTPSHRPPCC